MNEARKWIAVKPAATKAKLKEVSHWLLEPTRIQKRMIEFRGIIGKPETEDRTTFEILVGGSSMPEVAARMLTVSEKYDWTVTRDNADAIIEDCKLAYEELKHLIPVKDLRITYEQHNQQLEERLAREETARLHAIEQNRVANENRKRLDAIMPPGAKRVIFAEHDVDDCDIMTDYFSSHTDQWAVIGFSFSAREDFHALRAASGSFEPTKDLGPDAPASVEHRDNYSMGAGNYLKASHSTATGWRVRSHRLPLHDSYLDKEIQFAYTPPARPDWQPVPETLPVGIGVTATRNVEKNGIELRFPDKPSESIRASLKARGWRWSRFSSCWYHRFSQAEMQFAESFTNWLGPTSEPNPEPDRTEPSTEGDPAIPLLVASEPEQTQEAPAEPAADDVWQVEEINHNV